jgi:hypothetical protein
VTMPSTQYWKIDTYYGIAHNTHNGTKATLKKGADGFWSLSCVNCPAPFMFDELGKWWAEFLSSHPDYEIEKDEYWYDPNLRWFYSSRVC